MQTVAQNERKMQLFIRGMTNGVLSERDRLFQYSIGEFYQEMSLFLEEAAMKERELEKLKNK